MTLKLLVQKAHRPAALSVPPGPRQSLSHQDSGLGKEGVGPERHEAAYSDYFLKNRQEDFSPPKKHVISLA